MSVGIESTNGLGGPNEGAREHFPGLGRRASQARPIDARKARNAKKRPKPDRHDCLRTLALREATMLSLSRRTRTRELKSRAPRRPADPGSLCTTLTVGRRPSS